MDHPRVKEEEPEAREDDDLICEAYIRTPEGQQLKQAKILANKAAIILKAQKKHLKALEDEDEAKGIEKKIRAILKGRGLGPAAIEHAMKMGVEGAVELAPSTGSSAAPGAGQPIGALGDIAPFGVIPDASSSGRRRATAQSHRGSRSSTSTPSTPSSKALKRRENLAIALREKEEKDAEEKKKKEKQLQARRERGVRHRNPFVQKQQEELDAWNKKARLASDPAPAAAPASAPIDDKPEEDAPMDDGAQEGQQMDN